MKAQLSMKLIIIGLLSQIDFSHGRAVSLIAVDADAAQDFWVSINLARKKKKNFVVI